MEEIIKAAMSQTPEVVAQLVFMEKMDCIGWGVFCLVILIMASYAWMTVENSEDRELATLGYLFVSGFWLVAGLGLISNTVNFINATYAPKAVAVKAVIKAAHR